MAMQILRNQNMLTRLNQNLANLEMSNIAMVLNTPSILVSWFSIDVDLSEVTKGTKNVDDYIHPQSTVIYNQIDNVPMYGIDNLLSYSQYDQELAQFDEDFTSSGLVYPNTVFPKQGDCFLVEGDNPALYIVTDIRPSTVKSNPFIEVTFRIFSRDPKTIKQLIEYQVREKYETTLSSLGDHRALVVSKQTKADLEQHISAYLDIASLYGLLFYDRALAAFVYGGMPGTDSMPGHRCQRKYVDMVLWKYMFDEGVIIYDELLNYAEINYGRKVDRIYTSSPDLYLDEYSYKRSVLYRIFEPGTNTPTLQRGKFDEYRYPIVWRPTNRITKYQGIDIWYIDNYDRNPENSADPYGEFYLWDKDFLCHIRNNELYPLDGGSTGCDDCEGCGGGCIGNPVPCFNPYLRNVIINHFNGEEIDWDGLRITDRKTIENYYLIPLVLGIYKKYIQGLQG